MKHASRALLVLLVAAAVLPFMGSGVASAAAPPPTLQLPVGGSVTQVNPVFQWAPAAGAVRYRIQVSTDPGFSNLAYQSDTFNLRATVPNDLPNSQLYWKVASFDAVNELGAYSPVSQFTKSPGQPTPSSPLTGAAPFDYPNTPLVFSWTTLPNTAFYRIEIDDDINFSLPRLVEDNTVLPRYTFANPTQFNKVLYWRARAFSPQGFESGNSTPQQFTIAWNYRPVLLYPPNQTAPSIEEVRFDWNGGPFQATVPGATLYDLQVSSDINFNTLVVQEFDLKATAFTPNQTLPAADYYWRVRAKNAGGAVGLFSDPFVFRRTWPTTPAPPDGNDSVQLLFPADNGTVVEPNLGWSPARLASRYELWASTDLNFSPGTVNVCITNDTTFTPSSQCPAYFQPGSQYFWKVRPLDDRPGGGTINGVFSARRAFTYTAGTPTLTSPANGALIPVNTAPVLKWDRTISPQTPITNPPTTPTADQKGTGRYRVQVFKGGNLIQDEFTYNTQFVPTVEVDKVADVPVNTTFSWRVINVVGLTQQSDLQGGTRSFTIQPPTTGSFVTTSSSTVHSVTPPLLTWTVATGAVQYRVYRGVKGSGIFVATPLNPFTLTQPAYAHNGDNLTTGAYDWFAEAINKDGIVFDVTNVSSFIIDEIPTTRLTLPADCITNPGCPVLPETPILDWDPVPDATSYLVSIATDANFTNILGQYNTATPFTKLSLLQSLADNQASSTAYYWYARPCIGSRCAPDANTFVTVPPLPSCYTVPNLAPGTPCSPVRAFIKKSREILMISPTPPPYPPPPPTTANEITFNWQDYLRTNTTSNPVANQEAAYYQIQVSTTSTFQVGTIRDVQNTDATTYTDRELYPNGPLFWRVQAYDASNNALPFPQIPGQIVKSAPRPTLTAPAAGASVANSPLFSWQAQPYALDYQIEVFKNPSQGAQPTNLVDIGIGSSVTTAVSPRRGMAPGTYGWRVKYRDASFNEGPWSTNCVGTDLPECTLRTFTLTSAGVTLTSPADGALVAPNRALFTWNGVSTPYAQYQFELSNTPQFSAIIDAQNTVTPAYAPPGTYANGQWYWRVWTLDGNNNRLGVSSPVRSLTIGQPGVAYHPMAPKRILDSRLPSGPWGDSPLLAGSPRNLQVSGALPNLGTVVPETATAIIANVTATGSSQGSFLTVYPSDVATPNASNLNFGAGETIPNLVTVKLGVGGAVKIATAVGFTDVIVDVVGYYDDGTIAGDLFTGMAPARLLDSRLANSPWAGTKLNAGTPRTLQVAGSQGIPSGTTAAVMNVTVTNPSHGSFLTVYPGPGNVPTSSNLNFGVGQTIPNLVVVQLSPTGQATFANAVGSTNVIVDVVGYYGPNGDKFHVLPPTRVLDSRGPALDAANTAWASTKLGTTAKPFVLGGVNPVPITATGVVMNTTVTGGTANSFLTLYPEGAAAPTASNLNFAVGQTTPNLVFVKVGPVSAQQQSKISFKNNAGQVDVIADVVGYFAAQ